MFRIDSEDAVASLPSPKSAGAVSGYFSPGDPGLGQNRTVVGYDWLNAIQETIAHPILDRGLTLKKDAPYNLLTEAIKAFVADSTGVSAMLINLSGGVFTVKGIDGNNLSSTNYGTIGGVPSSATPGKNISLKVTANHSFNDDNHASSDLANLGFGITESANWAEDMPFFIYVANRNDTEVNGSDGNSSIFISRNPSMYKTPHTTTLIGDTGAIPSTDSQLSIVFMNDVTVANYIDLPCKLIGSFRMRWSTVTDDWTVQALNSYTDGLGENILKNCFSNVWICPTLQNGATVGHLFSSGTLPVFTDNFLRYRIDRDGICSVNYLASGDGGAEGSGSNDIFLRFPYAYATESMTETMIGDAAIAYDISTGGVAILSSSGQFYEPDGTQITCVQFNTAGFRNIKASGRFRAFLPSTIS